MQKFNSDIQFEEFDKAHPDEAFKKKASLNISNTIPALTFCCTQIVLQRSSSKLSYTLRRRKSLAVAQVATKRTLILLIKRMSSIKMQANKMLR